MLRRPGYTGNKSKLECRRLIFAWAVWVHRTAYLGMHVAGCTNPCPPHLLSIGNLSKNHRQVANVDSQYPSTIPLHNPTILTLCDLIYIIYIICHQVECSKRICLLYISWPFYLCIPNAPWLSTARKSRPLSGKSHPPKYQTSEALSILRGWWKHRFTLVKGSECYTNPKTNI